MGEKKREGVRLSVLGNEIGYIRNEDVQLLVNANDEELVVSKVSFRINPRGWIEVDTTLLLDGVDIVGNAVVNGQHRKVRVSSDKRNVGCYASITDLETNQLLLVEDVQFFWNAEIGPLFTVLEAKDEESVCSNDLMVNISVPGLQATLVVKDIQPDHAYMVMVPKEAGRAAVHQTAKVLQQYMKGHLQPQPLILFMQEGYDITEIPPEYLDRTIEQLVEIRDKHKQERAEQ